MRIVAIYKEFSSHGRAMEEFLHDFEKRTSFEIEEMNPEDAQSESFLRAYDIVEYPTILAITDDGRLLQMWRGLPLPRIDEVSYYLY